MSKPTLSQVVELNKMRDEFLYVWKDGKCYCIENDYVVKNFGDVEIYDLTVHLMGTQKKDGKVFVPQLAVILSELERMNNIYSKIQKAR